MSAAEDRITDLLVRRATEGLPETDKRVLAQALETNPELLDLEFESSAATIHVALIGKLAPMPTRLRAAVERDAALLFGGPTRKVQTPAATPATPSARWPWLAAAAALLIAVAGWWPQGGVSPRPLEAQYAELRAAGAVELSWTTTEDPTAAGASGTVLWDTLTQTGFMRFIGLTANDPTVFQYQLWIFDAERGEQYPVDGGVFDIPAGATEVTVPIDSRLPIGQATLFAVTVEQPGGVVVSSRERISVLASVG